jgi:hypothetical protein
MVMAKGFSREVDGRPTLAFEAGNTGDAKLICKESWLFDDLASLTSGGSSLGSARSKLSVRPARAEEAIVFANVSAKSKPSDDVLLAYLVDLDTDRP